MSWAHAGASAIGSSHALQQTPCQDAHHVESFPLLGGEQLLMAFVADGAGSAAHADVAARLAVAAAAQYTLEEALLDDALFDAEFAHALLRHVREALVALASEQAMPLRDLACTFLGVIAQPDRTLVFQLGDGAIVLGDTDSLALAIAPMAGEYANTTYFVCDDDAPARLAVAELGAAERIALFSDGLQRLALNADQTPHLPFFAPFFRTLSNAAGAPRRQLDEALARFLESPAVNERTDDDKSLVLALRAS